VAAEGPPGLKVCPAGARLHHYRHRPDRPTLRSRVRQRAPGRHTAGDVADARNSP